MLLTHHLPPYPPGPAHIQHSYPRHPGPYIGGVQICRLSKSLKTTSAQNSAGKHKFITGSLWCCEQDLIRINQGPIFSIWCSRVLNRIDTHVVVFLFDFIRLLNLGVADHRFSRGDRMFHVDTSVLYCFFPRVWTPWIYMKTVTALVRSKSGLGQPNKALRLLLLKHNCSIVNKCRKYTWLNSTDVNRF